MSATYIGFGHCAIVIVISHSTVGRVPLGLCLFFFKDRNAVTFLFWKFVARFSWLLLHTDESASIPGYFEA